MKKLLFALLLPTIAGAQMNLEHEYTGYPYVVQLSANGGKIVETDTGSNIDFIMVYTPPYNPWRYIQVPQQSGYVAQSITLISDHLFNNDDLLEYGVTYRSTTNPVHYNYMVWNEDEVMIFDIPGGYTASAADPDNSGNWKVFVMMWNNTTPPTFGTRQYAVSGELPCISCSGLKASNTNKQQPYLSEPVPNPSSGRFTVNYALPAGESAVMMIYNITGQQVATYPLQASKNSIEITERFIPGNYLYNIRTASGLSESKKLTIK